MALCTGGRRDKPQIIEAGRVLAANYKIGFKVSVQAQCCAGLGRWRFFLFFWIVDKEGKPILFWWFCLFFFRTRFVSPRWPHDSVSHRGFWCSGLGFVFSSDSEAVAQGSLQWLTLQLQTRHLLLWIFSKKPRRFKLGLLMKCERLLLWIVLSDKGIARSVSSVSHG